MYKNKSMRSLRLCNGKFTDHFPEDFTSLNTVDDVTSDVIAVNQSLAHSL